MGKRVEEDSGIDGARVRLLARRLGAVAPAGRWWPYDDPFEIAVSAVLTQRTTWTTAARAMEALRAAGLLTPASLASAPRPRIERAIRGSGFYRQKAKALQAIARVLVDRFGGKIENAFALDAHALRAELMSWRGVGDETADAIMLYAAGKPTFVVDAYTVRLMRRFGAIHASSAPNYHEVAAAWVAAGSRSVSVSRTLHGSIVDLCKSTCTKVPSCPACPLNAACPKEGVAARRPASARARRPAP